ncbi:hypothetical protein IWX49DRAFT_155042 [Phyllosticta citricarpa]
MPCRAQLVRRQPTTHPCPECAARSVCTVPIHLAHRQTNRCVWWLRCGQKGDGEVLLFLPLLGSEFALKAKGRSLCPELGCCPLLPSIHPSIPGYPIPSRLSLSICLFVCKTGHAFFFFFFFFFLEKFTFATTGSLTEKDMRAWPANYPPQPANQPVAHECLVAPSRCHYLPPTPKPLLRLGTYLPTVPRRPTAGTCTFCPSSRLAFFCVTEVIVVLVVVE